MIFRAWRPAAVTMVATLGSWLCAWWLASAAGLRSDVIVLGAVLPVTLARVTARERLRGRARIARLVALPVVAVAASEVGVLITRHEVWGGLAFVAVMAAAIWVRRFGSAWTTAGTLTSLPFVILLVAPISPAPGHEHTLWPALVAVIALAWVGLTQQAAWRAGFMPAPPYLRPQPAPAPTTGLRASTRMALQMGLSLALSYALGRWWFPDHWTWMLLSAYVVNAGNRGRGDVLYKGILRLAGALVGTLAATLLANAFATGSRASIVVLFVVMAAAVLLRPVSYAYWAAGVTAMLALLHGYYGEHGAHLIVERMAGLTLGAVIAVAVSWLVLPVRTRDAFRRRWADALAAVSELLTALRTGPEGIPAAREDLDRAVAQLELIEPTWMLHRRVLARRRTAAHPADLVALLRDVRLRLEDVAGLPTETLAAQRGTLVSWARQVGGVRKRMREDPEPVPTVEPTGEEVVDRATEALAALDAAFTRDVWRRLGG